jgi:hypothetical protein
MFSTKPEAYLSAPANTLPTRKNVLCADSQVTFAAASVTKKKSLMTLPPGRVDHRLDSVRHSLHLDHCLRRQGPDLDHSPHPHGLLQEQRGLQLIPLWNRVRR